MNKPVLNSCTISPNPANTKVTLNILLEVEDKEIIFGTDYKYAKSSNTEIYAGEDGII